MSRFLLIIFYESASYNYMFWNDDYIHTITRHIIMIDNIYYLLLSIFFAFIVLNVCFFSTIFFFFFRIVVFIYIILLYITQRYSGLLMKNDRDEPTAGIVNVRWNVMPIIIIGATTDRQTGHSHFNFLNYSTETHGGGLLMILWWCFFFDRVNI